MGVPDLRRVSKLNKKPQPEQKMAGPDWSRLVHERRMPSSLKMYAEPWTQY